MQNAVGYVRYSSDSQSDGYSIEAQKNAINQFATRENFNVLRFYMDEAKTGTNDNREAFLSLIADSKKKEFEVVLVHKLDRFSRNRKDSIVYRAKLKEHGVKLISVLEKIDEDNPEDIILLSVLEGMNQFYSMNLGREVKKGMSVAASKGQFVGGRVPLGFYSDRKTKKLQILESEAIRVRNMFQLVADGMTIKNLVQYTITNGYTTKEGRNYNMKTLILLLTNPVYIGTAEYRSFRKDSVMYKKIKSRPEIISVDNAYQAIIEQDTFHLVQRKIQESARGPYARKPKKTENEYLLTGKLFCEESGLPMVGRSSTVYKEYKNGSTGIFEYSNYRCNCKDHHTVKKETVENFIINAVRRDVFNEQTIQNLAEGMKLSLDRQNTFSPEELANMENQVLKIENDKNRLINLFLENIISKQQLDLKTRELNEKQYKLENDIEQANFATRKFDTLQLKTAIKLMAESLSDDSETNKKSIIDAFVERITYSEHEINITYKIDLPQVVFKNANGGGKVFLNTTYQTNQIHL